MSDALRAAFADQAAHCDALGSPFMGNLMRLCAQRLPENGVVAEALHGFQGDLGAGGHSVPLRFAGALHHLVLSQASPELAAAYPPHGWNEDRVWSAILGAMHLHADLLLPIIALPPQTNEIRRSAALIPALHLVASKTGLPLVLSELGASAGLNLLCDHYHLASDGEGFGPLDAAVTLTPEWRGDVPMPSDLIVTERAGVDLSPFDLTDVSQSLRLLSYLWPDQPDQIKNTSAAIELARHLGACVHQGDAIKWLEKRLQKPFPGAVHVIYHTVAWQYFPAELQERGEALLQAAGQRATRAAPLARFSMENDGQLKGARLTLQLWPDGRTYELGRVDFHGRWIDWIAPEG